MQSSISMFDSGPGVFISMLKSPIAINIAQKMKFFIKDCFSRCDQICSFCKIVWCMVIASKHGVDSKINKLQYTCGPYVLTLLI